MRTGIFARGFSLTSPLRDYAERRLRAALGRYRNAVHTVQMRLADINGPRGGVDKSCLVEVNGPALTPVVIRERDADLYHAIDRAALRLDRALARRVSRRHRGQRGESP